MIVAWVSAQKLKGANKLKVGLPKCDYETQLGRFYQCAVGPVFIVEQTSVQQSPLNSMHLSN